MQKLKKVWDWLVWSSVDAKKWSLTVKSVLYALIPATVYFAGINHIQLDSTKATEVINIIGDMVVVFGGIITGVSALVGLVRKIKTTVVGTNQVINE